MTAFGAFNVCTQSCLSASHVFTARSNDALYNVLTAAWPPAPEPAPGPGAASPVTACEWARNPTSGVNSETAAAAATAAPLSVFRRFVSCSVRSIDSWIDNVPSHTTTKRGADADVDVRGAVGVSVVKVGV